MVQFLQHPVFLDFIQTFCLTVRLLWLAFLCRKWRYHSTTV